MKTARRFLLLFFFCLLVTVTMVGLNGCGSCHVSPPDPVRLFPHEATAMGPIVAPTPPAPAANIGELERYPIVDIHTHTFNALYLPLMNIAQGRVREYPFGWVLSETVAVVLVEAIVGRTLDNENAGPIGVEKDLPPSLGVDGSIAAFLHITPASVQKGAAAISASKAPRMAVPPEVEKLHQNPDQLERILRDNDNWIRFGEKILGVDPLPTPSAPTVKGAEGSKLSAFLKVLTSHDADIRLRLPAAFDDRVSLFVHHTMDMGPTYAQEPDDETYWTFHGKQLDHVRELDHAPGNLGRYLHFVAFNPFQLATERTMPAGGWKNSAAIKLVDAAIKRGAWGVKYYPPSGYRPSGNDIPPRPTFGALPQAQWDRRYAGFTNEELDQLNFAFFEYCAENDIPVFAHCQPGEFQAARCYGERMAHPAYYREVLEKLANRPKPLHLRLCLGHAGGPDFWFQTSELELRKWGEQVYELCTRFPNVYCEVGVLSEILQGSNGEIFADRLGRLVNRPVAAGRYPFGEKIMYGSDWFMPDAAGAGVTFLDAYRDVFLNHAGLTKHYKNFFCLNALSYLGLGRNATPRQDEATAALRAKLVELQRQAQP